MSLEESPTPVDSKLEPPFLNPEQERQFIDSFTMDNFRIVDPPKGGSYVVMTISEEVQPLVENIRTGAVRAALNMMRQFGSGISTAGLTEEGEGGLRQRLSQEYEDMLSTLNKIFLESTWTRLSYGAYEKASIKALKAAASTEDIAQRSVAIKEAMNVDHRLGKLFYERHIILSGGKQVYAHPEDLVWHSM